MFIFIECVWIELCLVYERNYEWLFLEKFKLRIEGFECGDDIFNYISVRKKNIIIIIRILFIIKKIIIRM